MTFSQFAGTAIVPTFARLVLGVAFISLGWCRLTEWVEYPPGSIEQLQQLGVEIRTEPRNGETGAEDGTAMHLDHRGPRIVTASFIQDAGSQDQPPPESESESETGDAGQDQGDTQPPATEEPPAEEQATEPAPQPAGELDVIYRAQRMHAITLALDARGISYAKVIAMCVALTEMVGGLLLLIGLFSRLWAFALMCAMGMAFYFHTMGFMVDVGNPLNYAKMDNLDQFNHLTRHLSFFVLAMLVMLAGPGPLSLDRLLFRREPAEPEQIDAD